MGGVAEASQVEAAKVLEADKALVERCDVLVQRVVDAHKEARATLDSAIGAEPDEAMTALSTRFDTVSADVLGRGSQLCRAGERGEVGASELSQRLYCVDRRSATFSTVTRELKAEGERDAKQVEWIVDSKVTYLQQTVVCEEQVDVSLEPSEALSTAAGGLAITRGGAIDGGSLHLDLGDIGKFESAPVTLTASLLCETAEGEVVEKCNGGRLKGGDKFKVAFQVSTNAHIS